MPGVEIDQSTLWKKAREDKYSNIPDPKVAEKAKLIDELQKQVSEGTLTVSGSNDVLTMALGPEHPGRVRGVGAGISTGQYINLPRQHRVKFADLLKESVRDVLKEETLKMEARTKQLVEAERENLLNQLHQLIPNFDPSMLKLTTIQGPEQSPKNPMSDKASCSGALDVRALNFEDDNAKDGEKQQEMKSKDAEQQDEMVQSELNGEEHNGISENLRWLAAGPSMAVPSYRSYLINGVKFNTKAQDDVRTVQNSGVYLLAHTMQVASAKDKNPIVSNMGFYGVIQEI
ncbi:hypothetical protein L3X38_011377 [Prunus dulcis]|uniref:Uncharacterized protein n=1 Tax=Prunus dulcis TaxID=3755 RepID=A0AAD4WJR3_PRUDU|nr:hypothetical protein L3X38_011377 [Prunus dulcis]